MMMTFGFYGSATSDEFAANAASKSGRFRFIMMFGSSFIWPWLWQAEHPWLYRPSSLFVGGSNLLDALDVGEIGGEVLSFVRVGVEDDDDVGT
jgi:hypothetical protein